jgi:hypothetical protein
LSISWGKECLDNTLTGFLLLGISALIAHILIWRYAVAGGWALINPDKMNSLLLVLVALLWLVLVVLFQVATLVAVAFEIMIRI